MKLFVLKRIPRASRANCALALEFCDRLDHEFAAASSLAEPEPANGLADV